VLLVAATGATFVLAGCTQSATVPAGPASTSAPSSSGASSTSPSPVASTGSTSPSPAASTGSSSSSAATPSPAPDANAVTIDVTIKDGQVQPNGKKIDVTKGQTVVLNVTSDADDEIHAHTSADGYELEVTADQPATGTFVAGDTGSFEVESHHLEKIIAILVVR
jgi:FtsP/CotA-like multicopper oxidase with cupredoxin domain